MECLAADCGGCLRKHQEVVRYYKSTRRQMSFERSCGIDADDLFDSEILQRLEIGRMVNEVRKDMMCPVLTMPGYECDC